MITASSPFDWHLFPHLTGGELIFACGMTGTRTTGSARSGSMARRSSPERLHDPCVLPDGRWVALREGVLPPVVVVMRDDVVVDEIAVRDVAGAMLATLSGCSP